MYKRKKIMKKNLAGTTARSKGFQSKHETYGKVVDDHCVYLKHSSVSIKAMSQAICVALIRKLFSKLGYNIGDMDTDITTFGPSADDARGYRLLFAYQDPTTDADLHQDDYTFVEHETLTTASTNFTDMFEFFTGYMINRHEEEPVSLSLQIVDSHGDGQNPTYNTVANLNLQNEYMYMHISSVLRVQNRTLGPSSEVQADAVDAQPLVGKLFTFKHGDPRFRYSSVNPLTPLASSNEYLLQGIHWDGLDLIRATELTLAKYLEPPNKDKFANCISVKKIAVAPGETKQCGLSYNISGRFTNAMKKFRPQRGATTPDVLDRVFKINGKCQLIALEEAIHTVNTNKITVGYEREYVVGCWFQTKKPTAHATLFVEDAPNNNVPS